VIWTTTKLVTFGLVVYRTASWFATSNAILYMVLLSLTVLVRVQFIEIVAQL